MGFIRIVYKKIFGYSEEQISDFGFQMLGMFLTGEVSNDPTTYLKIALDPNIKGNLGNLIGIRKQQNDIAIYFDSIMDLTDEDLLDWILTNDPLDADDILVLPKSEFIHIVEHWTKAHNLWFEEIWIKCEDGVYWVEGVDPMR